MHIVEPRNSLRVRSKSNNPLRAPAQINLGSGPALSQIKCSFVACEHRMHEGGTIERTVYREGCSWWRATARGEGAFASPAASTRGPIGAACPPFRSFAFSGLAPAPSQTSICSRGSAGLPPPTAHCSLAPTLCRRASVPRLPFGQERVYSLPNARVRPQIRSCAYLS